MNARGDGLTLRHGVHPLHGQDGLLDSISVRFHKLERLVLVVLARRSVRRLWPRRLLDFGDAAVPAQRPHPGQVLVVDAGDEGRCSHSLVPRLQQKGRSRSEMAREETSRVVEILFQQRAAAAAAAGARCRRRLLLLLLLAVPGCWRASELSKVSEIVDYVHVRVLLYQNGVASPTFGTEVRVHFHLQFVGRIYSIEYEIFTDEQFFIPRHTAHVDRAIVCQEFFIS